MRHGVCSFARRAQHDDLGHMLLVLAKECLRALTPISGRPDVLNPSRFGQFGDVQERRRQSPGGG